MNVSEVEVSGAEWSLFLHVRCSLVHLRIPTLPPRLEGREVCQRGSRVTRHLRRSEEDLGSEVVFWMDYEWSSEFAGRQDVRITVHHELAVQNFLTGCTS